MAEESSEGSVIRGRYRLLRKLGQGGMGSVWLAEDAELLRQVAVKLMAPAIAQDPVVARRFRTEAQSAAALRTKHVVQVLDYGVDETQPFIVMEVLEGENLSERLSRVGRLPPAEALVLLTQVGRAVGQAHALGIVHRDLKPANVFITHDDDTGEELVKVLDFGIAKAQNPRDKTPLLETSTGQILGTPYYMSPEQISLRARVDTRTDIWAFGVLACEVLTGRRPFTADTIEELTLVICSDPLPVPSRLASVPAAFDEWFAQAAARDPGSRFESLEAALAGLRTALEEDEHSVSSARKRVRPVDVTGDTLAITNAPASLTLGGSVPKQKTSWHLRAAAGLGALVVVAGLVAWRVTRSPPSASIGADPRAFATSTGLADPRGSLSQSGRAPAKASPPEPVVVPKVTPSPDVATKNTEENKTSVTSEKRGKATTSAALRSGARASMSARPGVSQEELTRRQAEAKRRDLAKRLGVAEKP